MTALILPDDPVPVGFLLVVVALGMVGVGLRETFALVVSVGLAIATGRADLVKLAGDTDALEDVIEAVFEDFDVVDLEDDTFVIDLVGVAVLLAPAGSLSPRVG